MACACPATNTGVTGRQTSFGADGTHVGGTIIVPSAFDSRKTYPLAIVLHGRTDSGSNILTSLALTELKNMDQGVLVWAPTAATDPTGSVTAWNATTSCCWFGAGPPDEIAYLHSNIAAIRAAWPVNPNKIWIIGHSNGAFLAQAYAEAHPEVITGLFAINGYRDTNTVTVAQAVHVTIVGSTSDTAVLFAGDPTNASGTDVPDAAYYGAVATTDAWITANGGGARAAFGSAADHDSAVGGSETTFEQSASPPTNGSVQLWTMTGSGHLPTFTAGTRTTWRDAVFARLKAMVR